MDPDSTVTSCGDKKNPGKEYHWHSPLRDKKKNTLLFERAQRTIFLATTKITLTFLYGVPVTKDILLGSCQAVPLNPSSKLLDGAWAGFVNLVSTHDSTIVFKDKTMQRIGWRHSYNSCLCRIIWIRKHECIFPNRPGKAALLLSVCYLDCG